MPSSSFEQRLLHSLARDVAGYRGVLALAGYLVYLVDVDDAVLGALHVEVGSLEQLEEDVLHVLAHVAGLGQRGGVRYGERHVQHPGQGLGEEGLAAARGAYEQDVALLQLNVGLAGVEDALVVVVYGHGEDLFGLLLPYNVFVEVRFYLCGLRQPLLDKLRHGLGLAGVVLFGDVVLVNYAHAQLDALVADICAVAGDQPFHEGLRLAAEGAANRLPFVCLCHFAPHRWRSAPPRLPLVDDLVDKAVLPGPPRRA